MSTRSTFLMSSIGAALWLFICEASAPGIPVDDYWTGWRARQRAELATLTPPAAPPEGTGQPIDRFLADSWKKHRLTVPAIVDHRTFARRAYLDVVGLL